MSLNVPDCMRFSLCVVWRRVGCSFPGSSVPGSREPLDLGTSDYACPAWQTGLEGSHELAMAYVEFLSPRSPALGLSKDVTRNVWLRIARV